MQVLWTKQLSGMIFLLIFGNLKEQKGLRSRMDMYLKHKEIFSKTEDTTIVKCELPLKSTYCVMH